MVRVNYGGIRTPQFFSLDQKVYKTVPLSKIQGENGEGELWRGDHVLLEPQFFSFNQKLCANSTVLCLQIPSTPPP